MALTGREKIDQGIRKRVLLNYFEDRVGVKLRGLDITIAFGQISHMWKLGFDDDSIMQCIDWANGIWGTATNFPLLYRKIESWENTMVYKHKKEKK